MNDKQRLETDFPYFVETVLGKTLSESHKKMICKYDEVCVSTFNVPCAKPKADSSLSWKKPPEKKCCEKEQEGNTPMTANSEREYLVRRLSNAQYGKNFRSLFNLDIAQTPSNYKDLIAWIQAGKFTLDAKRTARVDLDMEQMDGTYYGSVFDGITFTAMPAQDIKGYEQAKKDDRKQYTAALDTISTTTDFNGAGLKALQDYEAWLPTVASPAISPATAQ